MFLNKKYLYVYFLISGILLGLSWIPGLTFLIFLAFLPFFIGEKIVLDNPDFTKKRKFLFWYSYLTFFIWNLIATWWVSYASFGGAAMA
ncbi:MAG: apolipoprotein N-acyltransferase, partial [Bacteroidota bacterium]